MLVTPPAGAKLTDLLGTLKDNVTVSETKTVNISLPPYGAAILVKAK